MGFVVALIVICERLIFIHMCLASQSKPERLIEPLADADRLKTPTLE
jgi:hypothetical protein